MYLGHASTGHQAQPFTTEASRSCNPRQKYTAAYKLVGLQSSGPTIQLLTRPYFTSGINSYTIMRGSYISLTPSHAICYAVSSTQAEPVVGLHAASVYRNICRCCTCDLEVATNASCYKSWSPWEWRHSTAKAHTPRHQHFCSALKC